MQVRSVYFSLEKDGSTAREWEDGAGGTEGDPARGRNPRFIVVDGATEAYDSLRWVAQLVTSFVGVDDDGGPREAPGLSPEVLHGWFAQMQQRWVTEAPATFTNVMEEQKFRQDGSFATLLGCELTGLDGPTPRWDAVALGDTVLFHVRDRRLLAHFPPIGVEEFGLSPDGVHTQPAALAQMMRQLAFGRGQLRLGDVLFLATDAFAQWILRRIHRDEQQLWTVLGELDHDATFTQLVTDHRAAGELKNDDVTLLRVHVVASDPTFLMVCL
jgi:hypothetical protein